jgi:hypothetical protein
MTVAYGYLALALFYAIGDIRNDTWSWTPGLLVVSGIAYAIIFLVLEARRERRRKLATQAPERT